MVSRYEKGRSAKTATNEMIYFLFSFKISSAPVSEKSLIFRKIFFLLFERSIFARKSEYHGPRPLDFILIIAFGGTYVKNLSSTSGVPVLIEICEKKSESRGPGLLFPLLGLVALKTRTFTP